MSDYFVALGLFWGMWLLAPILVDGLTALANLAGVIFLRRSRAAAREQLEYPPVVTIIVPVYNSEQTLEPCLRSIAAQDYPRARVEVLLVDNGSTDRSFDVFTRLQGELGLRIAWHSIINQGKAWALNAGIYMATGRYIVNVDSDIVLAPDALRQIITRMEAEPDLGAVTGAVNVLPPPSDASRLPQIIGECEFFEYLSAFHVGRQFQTAVGNLFTLAGAFSAFRREVLLQTWLYNQVTVTEDTDLTFELYERLPEYRVGCVSNAVAYTHPTESLGALYAQRVRWQRGQIEVCAHHKDLLQRPMWRLRGFAPARNLMVDHTIAFPRAAWTFLLPILVAFGYPASLITVAGLMCYALYLLVDIAWVVVAGLEADKASRRRLLRDWWLLPIVPVYRMLVYWFRISGFLNALAEPGVWSAQDPISQVRDGIRDLRQRVTRLHCAAFAYAASRTHGTGR